MKKISKGTIFDILKEEPKIVLDKVYGYGKDSNIDSTWACQAIFQSLSSLSKALIMRILFLDISFTLSEVLLCIDKADKITRIEVVEELLSLWLLIESEKSNTKDDISFDDLLDSESENPSLKYKKLVTDNRSKYKLHPDFQKNFLKALSNPQRPWSDLDDMSMSLLFDTSPPSISELESFSLETWNKVLGYLVGIVSKRAFRSNFIHHFLIETGYFYISLNELSITSKGYEFMLKDYSQQIWEFVCNIVIHEKINREEILSFLFSLSYAELGKGYSIDILTPTQRELVLKFYEIGLIFLHSSNSSYFYPTNAAINIIFGKPKSQLIDQSLAPTQVSSPSDSHLLKIIVETNLQVTAYVYSDLHLALLGLFVDIHLRFPNMAIGRITRKKSQDAYRIGITAGQIIEFLLLHPHPETIRRNKTVPRNITDQLILWENELKRIHSQPACVFDLEKSLLTKENFELIIQQLDSMKVLLWRNQDKKLFACPIEAKEIVRDLVNSNVSSSREYY